MPCRQDDGRIMRLISGSVGEVRARALYAHPIAAFIIRVAILILALLVVFALSAPSQAADGGHGDPSYTMALTGALAAALLCAIALFVRTQGLRHDMKRLEERTENLADRHWELKEAEERARSFLEAQGDVIVRRDGAGAITYASDAFCALAGRARSALVGTTFALETIEQGAPIVLDDGTRVHDQKVATPQGPRWIAWREVAVRTNSDEHTETQSVGRDVTDRAEAERALADARDQAEAANRAKSRFLAMVLHEIRTPLNGILGMADFLVESSLMPEQATYAKAIKTSGDTLLSLIEEILDFSKIEAGRLDLEARPFGLNSLVEEVVELLAPRAQEKGLEIAAYLDERLPQRVSGDATRLRQVLLNLAGNGLKFTERGGVAVIVEPGNRSDEVRFEVRDTGIGIAPAAQARIFHEFEQGESGTTRRFGGTGLGLAITKRIIERMGGRIGLTSTAGAGSSFEIAVTLPPVLDATDAPVRAPTLDGTAVLIVAPSPIEAPLVARRLAAWGARTAIVADEIVAAALMPERRWDAIVVDGAIGIAAAAAVMRAAGPNVARRLVLITPAERNALQAFRAAGFTGYLVKPLRAVSLAARFEADAGGFDREPTDAAAPPPARRNAPQGGASQGGLAILVAEDNDINALLARSLLLKLGHRPTMAENGGVAVESWHAARSAGTPFDLILMDVNMPELDGLAAAQRIRAAEADRNVARTPIIPLTANAFEG